MSEPKYFPPHPYLYLHRSLKMLVDKRINVVWVLSRGGLGKTYQIDAFLKQKKSPHVIFTGDMTPAYVHRFLYANNNKIIVFRDVAKLLRRLSMIDTLKSLTEDKESRAISYLKCQKKKQKTDTPPINNFSIFMEENNETPVETETQAESSCKNVSNVSLSTGEDTSNENINSEDDTPPTFEFTGQIIFEMNARIKRYLDDCDALFSRGRFVELVFSRQDIINQMDEIAKKNWEKTVTKYLVEHNQGELNFRLQRHALITYQAAKMDGLPWRKDISLMLENDTTKSRKYLYCATGYKPIKRIDFTRFLMKRVGLSYATAQRRIKEWLILEDIYSNGAQKQALLSLKPFRSG